MPVERREEGGKWYAFKSSEAERWLFGDESMHCHSKLILWTGAQAKPETIAASCVTRCGAAFPLDEVSFNEIFHWKATWQNCYWGCLKISLNANTFRTSLKEEHL